MTRKRAINPEVDLTILKLLDGREEVSALRLSAAVLDRTDRSGAAIIGSIVGQLKKRGLIEETSRGTSRTPRLYRITEAGRQTIKEPA